MPLVFGRHLNSITSPVGAISATPKFYFFDYGVSRAAIKLILLLTWVEKNIGTEIKASPTWRKEYSQGLKVLFNEQKILRAIGIYQGKEKQDGIEIFPLEKFLKALWSGKIEV